jgi:hypothetical protein
MDKQVNKTVKGERSYIKWVHDQFEMYEKRETF